MRRKEIYIEGWRKGKRDRFPVINDLWKILCLFSDILLMAARCH